MIRTSNTFSILQATAAIAGLAIILWSLGLPSLRFAEAANVTSFSDTLSDSAPSVAANHTIQFVTPSGMASGATMLLQFPAEFTGIGSLDEGDLDLSVAGIDQTLGAAASGATWGVTAAGSLISIESGSEAIGAGATVTVKIGTNASGGVNQITNPATTTSYEIDVDLDGVDTGSTRVAIVDTVTVSASVETVFTFSVAGIASSTLVNTADTTAIATTPTTIAFGDLVADTPKTAAQSLEVNTNAANGFVVTVQTDQQLTSGNGADIDGFRDGAFDTTPVAWQSPSQTPGNENEYGHWGLSSTDNSFPGGSDPYSGGDLYVAASSTPVEVLRYDSPTDGSGTGQGTADVIYKVEISALQEAASDYTATLTYVATPVF